VCLFTKNGVLMRKWRSPDVSIEDEWAVTHQIVILKSYRQKILSIALETPLSGHMGMNKTCQKIPNHFYWPSLRKDVAEFCKLCHPCQMVVKPNQTKAPLQHIPAVHKSSAYHPQSQGALERWHQTLKTMMKIY